METQHGGVLNAAVLVLTCGLLTLEKVCIISKSALPVKAGQGQVCSRGV